MEQLISIKDHKVILPVVENNKINKEINNFVIAIIPWCVLKNKLKHPRKENLIGLKKCIYYNDLKHTNGTCLI